MNRKYFTGKIYHQSKEVLKDTPSAFVLHIMMSA
jgi:hypothetical protein